MYIKSMVLDGFKSYAKRTEINGFDKQFNAITGFNGSGKSNVLDAICFVLGITSLQKVRANSLQDLVYKSGQAGLKKASVTITFDNRNKSSSPLGYEQFDEIIVTRQVVVGGKNKYMINGTNAQNKKVHDMFCSIQLNINNPHFLIMQGTITKVLNMKPREILSMLEEAAGTSMYETKKQESLKLIEKKEAKLKEIKSIITDELEPKLARLKEEKFQMAEYQRVQRELEQCKKIYIAFQYVKLLSDSDEAEKHVNSVKKKMEKEERCIENGKEEIRNIERQLAELAKKKDSEEGGKVESLSQELQGFEKQEHKLVAELNGKTETLETAKKDLKQLKKNLADDEKALAAKLKELEKLGGLFERLKERDRLDSEAVAKAQERYQKISMGLLENDTGENATLEQQLINAKQSAMQAQTELQQCEMEISHKKELLVKKKSTLKNTENESKEDNKLLENKQKELKTLTNEMNRLNYTEGTLEQLEQNRQSLVREIRNLQEKIHQFESRYPQLRFNYRDPDQNFNRKSVKGLVCKLFSLKEEGSAYALELAAGGRLYNVVVDNEETSKKLLNRGQLQQRVTIIPLNKISGRPLEPNVVKLAQDLAGKENVKPALSLIDFPEELRPAMTWVFGQIFVCKDMQSARTVAFHNNIRKKCVTISGDIFDPAGTLSGGATAKGGSVLLQLNELKVMQAELAGKEDMLKKVEAEIARVGKCAEQFATLKRRYDISNHEIAMVNQRLQQTTYHKIKEEIEELQTSLEELQNRMKVAKEQQVENSRRAKQLESQLSNAANIGEMQLKEAEDQLNKLQKKADQSKKEWQKHEQESDRLDLEVKELQKFIENGREEVTKAEENIASDTQQIASLQEELKEKRERISDLVANLKIQKDLINQQNKDMQKLADKKEKIIAQSQHAELEVKKLTHEIEAIESNASDCRKKVASLTRQNDWIEQEKNYFGKPGGMFDFAVNKPEEISQKVQRLESSFAKLSRNINMRVLTTITKEEEQHKQILKRKHIVENDKAKILDTIKSLDAKKEQTLISAWEEVNKNFGSIFSSLLPGAQAKLQPLENKTVLEGLEVKVGFSGVWKESLGELSGGQRSLVALSLILSMLLFKPAPLYILDEVDAALDLSHTENIGTMLKAHFKHSQFIIVSLKDGMFNNANVLFTTSFVDGMSTIHRNEKSRSA